MARLISDYIALALISNVEFDEDQPNLGKYLAKPKDFSGDLDELKVFAEEKCGFSLTDDIVKEAMRTLVKCGVLRITNDDYSGTFVKLKPAAFSEFVKKANDEVYTPEGPIDQVEILINSSDFPRAYMLLDHELLEDYHELGDEWLKRALLGIKKTIDETGKLPLGSESSNAALDLGELPRIVTLTEHQKGQLETASDELISTITQENAIDSDVGLREQLLGQFKAARELIRAKVFDAQIMRLLVMDALKSLIKKYEGHVIGAAATKLMDLLITHGLGIK